MKKHYKTLGLKDGASQEEIQTAYERLSKELDPKNNANQEFFIEEYKKVQEAYKALSNSSILATEKGAKQVFEKPNPSPKTKSASPKKLGTETQKKAAVTKSIIFSIAIISIAIIAYVIYNSPRTYKRTEIVFNKDLAYVKKDMSLLNGKINDSLHKGEFVNGMKEGLHREWNANGQLEKEGSYVNGEIEGLWRSWHANGQLESEGNYIYGKIEGLWRFWHENGQLEKEGNYVDNMLMGSWSFYHKNGNKHAKGVYNGSDGKSKGGSGVPNSEREGLWRFWNEKGVRYSNSRYSKGKEI